MTDLTTTNFDALAQIAGQLAGSRYCTERTPEDALWIVATGASLGLDPVTSLRGIHVIKGKPVLSADLMAACALNHPACVRFLVVEMSAEGATVEVLRQGWGEPIRYSFTKQDAQTAGLWGKGNWRTYPADMMKARAISRAARAAFPDALLGCYVTGELDQAESAPEAEPAPAMEVVDATSEPVDYSEDEDWKRQSRRFFAILAGAQKDAGEALTDTEQTGYRDWFKAQLGVESWKHIQPRILRGLNDKLDGLEPEDVLATVRAKLDQAEDAEFEEVA